LLGQGQDRDAVQIDLLAPREIEQEVERPLIAVDIDEQRRLVLATRAMIGWPLIPTAPASPEPSS